MTRITQSGLAAALMLSANLALADISGTVFRDYDADGVRDSGEPGLGAITVTAYDAAGTAVATATSFAYSCSAAATPVAACTGANTPALGSYSLAIASGGPFRVEFSGADAAFATAAYGTNSLSSVQFVANASATPVDAGFNNPAQYCAGPVPPAVVAGFFTFGNVSNITTLYGFDYDARGATYDADPTTAGVQPQRRYGVSQETGAVYGIAYQRRSKSLFSSAYVHRGSPLGATGDTGTIYRSPNVERGTTNISAAEFITVNGLVVGGTAIDTGANPHPAGTDWTRDAASYPVVGKRGLGDLEISEDGQTLYTINLNQRELLVLPIGNTPTAPTPAQIVRVPVPVPASCSGTLPSAAAPSTDDIRPFATKFFDGRLYIGMVCTAQSMRGAGASLATAKAALRGYIWALDPATNTFDAAPTFEFPLDYPRQFLNNGIGSAATDGEWNPWNDTYQPPGDAPGNATFWIYPQPLITDIEFDAEGRMAIGLRDRLADQAFDTDEIGPDGSQNDQTRQGGDLLLACRNGAGGAWTLENNGSCGTSTTSDPNSGSGGSNANSGPGNREFYWEEYYDFDFNPDYHRETAMGALLWRPGSGNFMSTVYDVEAAFNGGVRVYRNDNGANARLAGNVRHEFRVYEDGTSTFGKAGGIGDIELLCQDPPVELGNRVWRDSNGNGRQDPGEPALAGVVINLYDAAGSVLGRATTDADGHFLFLFSAGATDANPVDNQVVMPNPYGAAVTLLVAPNNFNAGGPLVGFTRTLANADASTGGTLRDSNGVATTVGGGGLSGTGFNAVVGQPGRNDHSIDFGFGIVDFGDLPDSGAGTGSGNYSTLAADNGASHAIVSGLQLGATVDGEADGQPGAAADGDDSNGAPDDEDGVTVADLTLRVGATPTVRVNATNTTGSAAQICGFIDFNGDGDFADAGESAAAVAVPNGSSNVQFAVGFPAIAAGAATDTYARFRLSNTLGACSAVGALASGEVEDYAVRIDALDFGDLPDAAAGSGPGDYNTRDADNGASHTIAAGIFLGAGVDAEADGQPGAGANDDDGNGVPDDEDGVTVADLQFVAGAAGTVRVNVTNLAPMPANLCGYVDFNRDGDFSDAGESASLVVNPASNNVQLTLNFGTVSATPGSVYARFRLGTGLLPCSPVGNNPAGEVEDYVAGVTAMDLGDLPDTTAGTGVGDYSTLLANNGPRHPRTPTAPTLGATVDTEGDGQPNAAASGDGADEDGVDLASLQLRVTFSAVADLTASNPGAGPAQICGFLDFNGDGDFSDPGESAPPVSVPAGTVNAPFGVNFGIVPVGAAASTYARFRISSDLTACAPDGAASDGEVEDYRIAIATTDLGDLPDTGAGNGPGNYSTLIADNGASHRIIAGLYLGQGVDAEADGQPNSGASGDDANSTLDDEDGVTIADLALQRGVAPAVRVNVTNTSGLPALLCGFLDYNADGDFNDAGETAQSAVPNGSSNVQFTLNFGSVPNNAAAASYGRFRLNSGQLCTPDGAMSDGEVEDYPISTGNGVLSLGNRVWNDRNNNGLAEAGEPGLSGVAVRLYRDSNDDGQPDGAAIASTSTAADGLYLFQNLDPDTYLVEITPPSDYLTSTGSGLPPYLSSGSHEPAPDPDNNVDNDDNGTNSAGVIRSAPVTLSIGGEPVDDGDADSNSNLSVDFGLVGSFDLALRKTLSAGQSGPFAVGQDVSFDITVFNQGSIPATTIAINDYIPAGFALSPSETNWSLVLPTLATRTIAGPLAPGASTTVTISLRVQAGAVSPLINRAEIASADDDGNINTLPPGDIDSTPDGNPDNDAGGSPNTGSDDATGGNGTGTPGGTDPNTDEDDADPAQVDVVPAGGGATLGLAKAAQILSISGGGGYGDGATAGTAELAYVIVVRNYSSQPITDLQVVENLVNTFGNGSNWRVNTLSAPTLTLNGAYDGRGSTNLLSGTDVLAAGATTTIRLVVNVQFRAGQTYSNQVSGNGLIGGVAVGDLSHNGSDPAPGGDPADSDTPTEVRLGMQRVPLLSPWSYALLLLGLAALAWSQRRRLAGRY